jgi:alpha-1,6-mannosyltransferase
MDERGRGRSIDPYWIVAAVLLVLLVVQTLNRRWSSDFWMHKVTIDTLRTSLRHPIHPLTGTSAHFEYYSPYTYALAVVARVTGWSTIVVLQVAGVFNLSLFLVAFRLFVGALTKRLAVTFALIATLVFWGWHPWRWSGYLNMNSIGFGLPYPSMFATGLALVLGWALIRYAATRNGWWLVAIGAGLPTVMLSHPPTGLWTCVMLVALAIHYRLYRRPALLPLLGVAAVTTVLLLLWPAYPFFRLVLGPKDIGTSTIYSGVPIRLCAAAVGVVPLWWRWKRDRTDPLVLMFLGGGFLYAVGFLLGNDNMGRLLPLALLAIHVGIGELVASFVDGTAPRSRPLLVWVGLSALVGFAGIVTGFASMVPRTLLPASLADRASLQPITTPHRALDGALPERSVVVVPTREMEQLVAAYGYRPLSVHVADAFVSDADERRAVSREILDPATSAGRRQELLDKYDVAGVVCTDAECTELFDGTDVKAGGLTLVQLRS